MFENWLGTTQELQDPWYVQGLFIGAAALAAGILGILFILGMTGC